MDTEPLCDEELIKCVKKSQTCCRLIKTIGAAVLFIFFIIFPSITELILAANLSYENVLIMLIVCGSLQTLFAMYGAIRLGMTIFDTCISYGKEWPDFWGKCQCTELTTLTTGGYIIFTLPQWVLINMSITWHYSIKNSLPLYVHIPVYLPLITYTMFIFVGYALNNLYLL